MLCDIIIAFFTVFGIYCLTKIILFLDGDEIDRIASMEYNKENCCEEATEMNTNEITDISGTVDSVIFSSEETGYTVIEIEMENGYPATLVGTMPYIAEGDTVKAVGKWTNHPSYGLQFKVESYEKILPTSEADILRYLSSGAIKGIGPKTAAKIVEKFGEDSFDVIENHPDWLAAIPGISRKKADEITTAFVDSSGARDVMMFCSDYFGSTLSMKIYQKWGNRAVDMIKADPYMLCTSIAGISFTRADAIAASLGISPESESRIEGGIIHTLNYAAQSNGHTCLPIDELAADTAELLLLDVTQIKNVIEKMIATTALSVKKCDGRHFVFLPRYRTSEIYTAKKLIQLDSLCPAIDTGDVDLFILRSEKEAGISYAARQREAIHAALERGVTILTGGPGTGKTTIIKGLISIFQTMGFKIALAAPTGRAAKRMSETTGCEAKTVHRLLEMEYQDDFEPRFVRCESCRLDEDVFILDEASMMDAMLTEAFLRAVKPGSRVIFIGDRDQLPSVGAGNILADLIASERFTTVCLTEIFRQSENSMIVLAAHDINNGHLPSTDNANSDFFFMGRGDDASIVSTVCELCETRLPRKYGSELAGGIQVITPSRKGECGTEKLNATLQSVLNPPAKSKAEKISHGTTFRVGDKVMQIKNNYSIEWEKNGSVGLGIFNGDIGVILEIDHAGEKMLISFDDRLAEYDFSNLAELELAYAITVHKSQGSEYPIVIFPLYHCPPMLKSRNLLYTAVTRASKMVVLVGRRSVLSDMVNSNFRQSRYTGLRYMLKE